MTAGGRTGGLLRRDRRGAASFRVLLALVASTVVTAAVSVPMAYQAHEARQGGGPRPAPTSTTLPREPSGPPASVLPSTTERDIPSIALPADTLPPGTTEGSPTTTQGRRPRDQGGSRTTTTRPRSTPTTPTGGTQVAAAPTTAGSATTAPPTAPTTLTATIPPDLSGDGILWAADPQRRQARPLAGDVVRGQIWVFVSLEGASPPRFWLDGVPIDVQDVQPLDTAALSESAHWLLMEVFLPDGSITVRLARFTVRAAG